MHELQAPGDRRSCQRIQSLQQGLADRAHAQQGDAHRLDRG
ncbi:MAG TPA: hypothetical protein VGH80_05480 [Xanthomonadaceae bacterium]